MVDFGKLGKYEESHTEWTICFLKLMETIMCLVCMVVHIKSISYIEEPMPHILLFCATYGGFFILCLAGMFVPFSGQLTPPGVDFVFCSTAFVLLFSSAIMSMYYVTTDLHLQLPNDVSDEEEGAHHFFKDCCNHCIVSLATASFFLMHACFSADRLKTVRQGLDEEHAVVQTGLFESDIPMVDIPPDKPITLYLFMLDFALYIYNSRFAKIIGKFCRRYFVKKKAQKCPCHGPRPLGGRKKRKTLDPHQKAALKAKRQVRRTQLHASSTFTEVDLAAAKEKDDKGFSQVTFAAEKGKDGKKDDIPPKE